ncbi:MAG: polymerase III subunit beta protein [Parcubacteria group bacterium GW2011_GWA2_43_17]|nr:MAG: polymerase III subunit beta protein [Parcubacteria group bacterium GW2011_GWA2_43_17]KKT93802.1 MAG: polymerase III subunit beta protein [Parcubacteria group bacterium GW2011_GWF2_45_11]KKT97438.1 MAG: polymerase III subunit beta protein [Parcubacteria group bacterium GW2011_GWC2_45_15]OGY94470.1 MAG: DNA polymerase III subunit beta [Candidatus Komeilibacteria bacterium RIFOXYC2_FULL_45_12]HAH04721.1 DNA polymerase III subunit beta [Candidatus Komeilibacteria bacterium]
MKFTCTQENLNKALALVSHVASRSATLPILNNVLLEVKNGLINLNSTNLEIGINTNLRGKVEKEGSFTVQAKLLADYINLLPKENVEIELKDQTLYVKSKNQETYVKGLDANDFPVIPEVEKGEPLVVKSADLRQALNQVMFAVTLDESRPEISGVLFLINKTALVLVGTDSYRLAEKKITFINPATEEKQIIVPLRTLQELSRILNEVEGSETNIYVNDSQILFSLNGEVELISRLIEGQYPDYQQIIPTEFKSQIKIRVDELIRAIKSVSLFCKPGINDVKFSFLSHKKELVISAANSGVGENTVTLPIDISGNDNEVVFNYRYFLDGLNNLGSAEATIEMVNDSAPGVVKPAGQDSYLYIVMPIRQ